MKFVTILIIFFGGFQARAEETPAWLKDIQVKCVDLFAIKSVKFHEGRAQSDQWKREGDYSRTPADKIPFDGHATMTAFVEAQLKHSVNQYRTVITGKLGYTVVGNQVTITSMVHKPEYDGQGVYRTLIASIVSQNQQVDTLVATLNGANYVKFQQELAANGGDIQLAMKQTAVGKELSELGFREVLWVEEINYANSGNFVIPQFYRFGIKRKLPTP